MKHSLVLVAIFFIGLVPAICLADNITVSIVHFADDAEEDITGPMVGNVRRSSSDLEIGNENGVEHWVGLRFQNLAIPPGAVINSASIKFTASETDVGTLTIPIFGELSDDADEFSDLLPITTRPLTTATTIWEVDPWFPGDSGVNTTTTDLAAIVQEIVDQSGWELGNSLAFILLNDPGDTSERIAVSFDGNPAMAAELSVDFSTNSGPILADSITVIRGIQTGGSVLDLHVSDNVDYTVLRNRAQIAGVVEVELKTISPTANPTVFEFSLESAGFFRSTVIQSIEFFDYDAGVFVEVDSRDTCAIQRLSCGGRGNRGSRPVR